MQSGERSNNGGALLAIEIGAGSSSVVLVDRVEDSFRLLARAERPSTHRPPIGDVLPAVHAAIGALERLTGRQLLHGEALLRPQRPDGSGVDAVVAACSDYVALGGVLLADRRQPAMQQAQAALRGLPLALHDTLDPHDADWEQRMAAAVRRGLDVVVALDQPASLAPRIKDALASMAGNTRPLLVVDGAEAAQYAAIEGIDVEHIAGGPEALRAVLRRRLQHALLQALPGLQRLRTLGVDTIGSVWEERGPMLRFLAQQQQRALLYAGADSSASFVAAAGARSYAEIVEPRLGLRAGAAELMRRRGAEAIARWLPTPVPVAVLRNHIMNRTLRPRLRSIDGDDLQLDAALLREALFELLAVWGPRRTLPDTLIGAGDVAAWPSPALAALTLLDVLPAANGIVELTLDRGILAAAAAVARVDPTAAAALASTGEPLATAVLLGNTPALRSTAAQIQLTAHGSQTIAAEVRRGQIVRLPLARGKRAVLRVQISGLGGAGKGIELRQDVRGSTLGIVIDARPGRPALPKEPAKRAAALRDWLSALDHQR